jgi:membrane fusion protein, multidrug efflux system
MADEDLKNYQPPTPGKWFLVGGIGAVVAAVALTAGLVLARGLWIERQSSELARRYAEGRRVLVTRVLHGPRVRELSLPASIHGYVETPIYAKIPGYLKRIDVDKGDRVKRNRVLAVLESPEVDQQVVNTRANYELQAVTDRRNQTLLRKGVIARQLADESHAAMLQAKATLDQLIATQRYEIIRAPFGGMITARYVDPGALIPQVTAPSSAGTPIVSMATLSPLRVYADVPQSVAPFIRDGDQATITVSEFPGRRFKGSVTRHPEALNSATRTMLVEVDLPNRDRKLLPGMYATADFAIAMPAGAPMVPDDALVFIRNKVFVPVVRGGRLHLAAVTLGYDNGLAVEITSGIADDDIVAINVGQSVREGEVVQPVFATGGGSRAVD